MRKLPRHPRDIVHTLPQARDNMRGKTWYELPASDVYMGYSPSMFIETFQSFRVLHDKSRHFLLRHVSEFVPLLRLGEER